MRFIRPARIRKSRFVEMFGLPLSDESAFPIKTIGDIATEVRYGTSRPAVEGGKYVYLRMNNLTSDGQLDLGNIKHITVPEDELEKCIVRKGDLLFNRTNSKELVGKTALFNLDEPMIIAGYLIRVRFAQNVLPLYVSQYMNLPPVKKLLTSMSKGAVNQANISAKELQTIRIPVPPLELQRQFAAFIEQLDKSEFALRRSLDACQKLYRQQLQEAFG